MDRSQYKLPRLIKGFIDATIEKGKQLSIRERRIKLKSNGQPLTGKAQLSKVAK
jgi:hypothetical protein